MKKYWRILMNKEQIENEINFIKSDLARLEQIKKLSPTQKQKMDSLVKKWLLLSKELNKL